MKKILTLILAATLPCLAFAQAQITTKKMKLQDFTSKTTKVVLTGNAMFDGFMQKELKNCWNLSPVDFITLDQYEQLKNNPDYYFLMNVKGQFRKESVPGIEFLTLVKGGLGSEGQINDLFEVVTMPLRSADDPSGREFEMLGAILDVIQDYVKSSIESDINAYAGLSNYNLNLNKGRDYSVVFAEDDLAPEVLSSAREAYVRGAVSAVDTDEADNIMSKGMPHMLVSYVVAPSDGTLGSYCYKMLIDAGSHKLFFFKRHKISRKFGVGFLVEDLKKIDSAVN